MKKIIWPVFISLLTGCASTVGSQAPDILGEWHIEYIGERPVIDHSPATIAFERDGRFGGNASCNRYFGSYTLQGSQIRVDERVGATKMMCAVEALMEQEDRLFATLPTAVTASIENGILVIRDDEGGLVLKAARTE